jgi:hypothetical protein
VCRSGGLCLRIEITVPSNNPRLSHLTLRPEEIEELNCAGTTEGLKELAFLYRRPYPNAATIAMPTNARRHTKNRLDTAREFEGHG